jgi:dipeptidyl aminopeptidase/acylaminoacyl peptidase
MNITRSIQAAIAATFLLAFATGAVAARVPISHFFTHNTILRPELSPSGRYLAILTLDEKDPKRNRLGIYDLKKNKIYRVFSVREDYDFNQQLFWVTHWVNDNHLIAEMAVRPDGFHEPMLSGRIYTISLKYKRMRLLQGQQAGSYAGYTVLSWLRDDPGHILTSSVFPSPSPAFHHKIKRKPSAYLVSVRAGARHGGDVNTGYYARQYNLSTNVHRVTSSPLENGHLVADNRGRVRLATGFDPDSGKPICMYRDAEKPGWETMSGGWIYHLDAGPVSFTPDDKALNLFDYSSKTGTLGLYRLDPSSGKKTLLFDSPQADIGPLIYGFDHQTIIGAWLMPGRPTVELFDKNADEAKILVAFKSLFPEEFPSILSWSKDHSRVIVKVSSDRDPGQYYLLDTRGKTHVTRLFKVRPDIDPKKMAPMKPITFKARDGKTIHGYLTLPIGQAPKDLPLIVHPHGGPYGVRDEWGFDPMVQFLDSRGYAVLQINFRGSAGYGWRFEEAGFKDGRKAMQYDVIDGTKWAIKKGYANPKRICIFGASYGGYAALRSSEIAPDLYRCTVGYDGVYDLSMRYTKGDTKESAYGRYYLGEVLGHDHARLEEQSPVNYVKRLTGGLMLIEGGKDVRVPPAQVEELMKRLDAAGKSYEYLYKPHEAHGFMMVKNQRELARKLEKFFGHWIGSN